MEVNGSPRQIEIDRLDKTSVCVCVCYLHKHTDIYT